METDRYQIMIRIGESWKPFNIGDTELLDTATGAEFLARECGRYRPDDEFRVKVIKGEL